MDLEGVVGQIEALVGGMFLSHGSVDHLLFFGTLFVVDNGCGFSDDQSRSGEVCGHISKLELDILELGEAFSELFTTLGIFYGFIQSVSGSSKRATGYSKLKLIHLQNENNKFLETHQY